MSTINTDDLGFAQIPEVIVPPEDFEDTTTTDDAPVENTVSDIEPDDLSDTDTTTTTGEDTLSQYLSKKIEQEGFQLYDDYKEGEDIGEYLNKLTPEDKMALLEENIKIKLEEQNASFIENFKSDLPVSIQYLIDHYQAGNTDLKPILKQLSTFESNRELDLEKEEHQETVLRNYYSTLPGYTQEEIEKEIDDLKSLNRLKVKAEQIKPKLDLLEKDRMKEELEKEQEKREAQKQATKLFYDNLKATINKDSVGNIKIPSTTKQSILKALTEPIQTPAGKVTQLTQLLQNTWSNPEKLVKLTWFLMDEKSYIQAETTDKVNTNTRKLLNSVKNSSSGVSGTNLEPLDIQTKLKPKGTYIPRDFGKI